MGGKPRNFGLKEHRPSPLKQEISQRPLSMDPNTMDSVRDPVFWKRFSTAVRNAEVDLKALESGLVSETLETNKASDSGSRDWLDQQYREKRQCIYICLASLAFAGVVVTGAIIVVLYFTGKIHF